MLAYRSLYVSKVSMRYIDFNSWHGILTTIVGLAVFTLLGVGLRMLMMQTIQQRRERMNRQINERLRTLIAAYKVLGGSFTGRLTVSPAHLRDVRAAEKEEASEQSQMGNSERSRRVRDAVEAALSDIILLGTEEHVRLASQAAVDMVAGRPIHTAELVVSLRNFIRTALDLGTISSDVEIPLQGPTRVQGGSSRSRNEGGKGAGGGGGGGGGNMGGGAGMGMGTGVGPGHKDSETS